MKNKSTLTFSMFFLSCCLSLFVNAQQSGHRENNLFQLEVIEYSAELNSEKPRYHILSLSNSSNKELTIDLSSIIDDSKGGNNKNLIVELLNKDLTKTLNSITLQSKQSIMFKVKITFNHNARLGSMNVCKVIAQLPNSDIKEAIKINTYIPHPNLSGH